MFVLLFDLLQIFQLLKKNETYLIMKGPSKYNFQHLMRYSTAGPRHIEQRYRSQVSYPSIESDGYQVAPYGWIC